MAELRPYPLAAFLERLDAEIARRGSIFELERSSWFTGSARDLSVPFHHHRASSALGPAAGPHTQMAQNIVLSWLAGCRIMELKTVQILDRLRIPRPCIDMATVGYNVEWSQELTLEESLDEYVKASMLIRMLEEHPELDMAPGYRDTVFDMSVGYDLAGIRSDRVQTFIDRMVDARPVIDRLRAEIPASHAHLRELDYQPRVADTITLSTFHGCPPDEIERIAEFLLREKHTSCIIKLNPTLLGRERVLELLHDQLGYTELQVPESAFAGDTTWPQAVAFTERLGALAASLGLGFGVKFSNTLIVENHRTFFPESERSMYLSGPPLHVLAVELVHRFRQEFGDRFPISFSAGIDRQNFADAVAIGLAPVTVCSDLLKPGGYSRAPKYLGVLERRMAEVGAKDVDEFILRAYPGVAETAMARLPLAADDPVRRRCRDALARAAGAPGLAEAAGPHYRAWLSAAKIAATEHYAGAVLGDARYARAKNNKPPRQLDTRLQLFDCVACDKCVPVCPNVANFSFTAPVQRIPKVTLSRRDGTWRTYEEEPIVLVRAQQYATFADFCNECGNCDVFCPERGGPYLVKPLFFGTEDDWRAFAQRDGFHLHMGDGGDVLYARIDGRGFEYRVGADTVEFVGPGFEVTVAADDPSRVTDVRAPGDDIDFTYFHIARWMHSAMTTGPGLDFASTLARATGEPARV